MKKSTHICCNCQKAIPSDRVEALKTLGKDPRTWTHVQCSTEKAKKGVYLGEHGTSELLIVRKVYDDSVRDVMTSAEKDSTDDESS